MASRDDILLEEAFEQKPLSKATFLRLLGYVRPYRRIFRLNLLFTLLATASTADAAPSVSSGCHA